MEAPENKQAWLAQMEALSENTVSTYFGIEIVDLDDDEIVLRMPITDKVRQPMGLLHGGMNMVLAETAASLHACWGVNLSERAPVGIDINGTHVRSATEGWVRVVGRVIRRTQSFIFHEVQILHEESGDLLSIGRVTNYYKKIK